MKFKVFRDWLQQTIYKIINPIVHGMIKIGITPNFITTTGLILNIVAACIFLYAGMKGERGDLDRKSTRLNSSHVKRSRMPSSA